MDGDYFRINYGVNMWKLFTLTIPFIPFSINYLILMTDLQDQNYNSTRIFLILHILLLGVSFIYQVFTIFLDFFKEKAEGDEFSVFADANQGQGNFAIYTFITECLILATTMLVDCSQGLMWSAHVIMIMTGVVFFITDYFLYNLVQGAFTQIKQINVPGRCKRLLNQIWNSAILGWLISEFIQYCCLFDFYTDLCFVVIVYDTNLFWIAAIFLFVSYSIFS